MKGIVQAPARLHLGFIDLNGQYGRMFGSIGVAIERPRWVLEVGLSARTEADGDAGKEILKILRRLRRHLGVEQAVQIRTLEAIPRHMGFGSGTQLELSLSLAISELVGRPLPVTELARILRRGKRSGIGIAAFAHGGFVVDAGRPCRTRAPRVSESFNGDDLPPVIFQRALPEDWCFVIVSPLGEPGLSGKREENVFVTLPPMGEATVERISRLTLMKVLPGVITDDIRGFGEAITEIQALVGEFFAPYQGGVYATPTGKKVADFALRRGACGVGQSSWGPTVFALVRGEDTATALAGEIKRFLGDDQSLVFPTRASNRGAVWQAEP